jgi:hypothetical protein
MKYGVTMNLAGVLIINTVTVGNIRQPKAVFLLALMHSLFRTQIILIEVIKTRIPMHTDIQGMDADKVLDIAV